MEENLNVLSGGLNLDALPDRINDGEYTFALNGKLFRKGGSYFLNNLEGNSTCAQFIGYNVIGDVCTNNPNEHILFMCNPNDQDSDGRNNSQIVIGTDCEYTQITRSYCLNFRMEKPIQAEYKEGFKCGRVIYFVDDYNLDRRLDLNNIPLIDGELDCDAIAIDSIYSYPSISLNSIQDNGILLTGAYQFCLQYADENGIGLTDPTDLTNQVDIIRHTSSSIVAGNPPNIPTNKSIILDFDNLDTSFSHFNLLVLKTINQVKIPQKVITLGINTNSYTYTGSESSTQDLVISDIIDRRTIYTHSKTIESAQGYLLRGNLEENQQDNFQPYANNIQIQWETYRVNYSNYLNTYKSEKFINEFMSLLRDEVYPIGIRLLYPQGNKSCVYHIPGRKKNYKADGTQTLMPNTDQYGNDVFSQPWDEYTIDNLVSEDNYDSSTERWQVYNTGFQVDYTDEASTWFDNHGNFDGYEGCFRYGEMSYWESSLTYPDIPDVWNNGSVDLAGEFIRHHKMPDCSIVNIFDNSSLGYLEDPYIEILGLKIDNIIIDPVLFPNVVGYEIVCGDRTYQKSILDKGLLFNNMYHAIDVSIPEVAVTPYPYFYTNWVFNDCFTGGSGAYPNAGNNDIVQKDSFTGYSPNSLFNHINVGNSSELKIESEVYGICKSYGAAGKSDGQNIYNNYAFSADLTSMYAYGMYNNFILPKYGELRRSITNIEYINANVPQSTGFGFVNNIYRESSLMFNTNNEIEVCTIHDETKIFAALFEDGEAVSISSYYYSLKNNIPNLYGNIEDVQYYNSGKSIFDISETSQTCLFLGDTFITKFAFHKRVVDLFASSYMSDIANYYNLDDLDKDNTILTAVPIFFVESNINTEYRNNGTNRYDYFYPNLNYGECTTSGVSSQGWLSLFNMWIDSDNAYLYNVDYSTKNNSNSICVPLDSYDATDCPINLYTRVIYSNKNNQESLADNWRVFLPNNYYDFDKNKGDLYDIKSLSGDRILFRFENGIFLRQLNQQLETLDNTNVNIGAGTLFSPDPVELFHIDKGYIGTSSQFAFNSTPEGVFMVDASRAQIFKFGDSFLPISSTKMQSWFNDNLPLNLTTYFPDFPNFDNACNPNGIGFISTYDSKNKTWILTKKDYVPLYPEDTEFFNDINKFKVSGVQKDLTDSSYFENKSWSIGYNTVLNVWESWYSFLPNYYFQDSFNYNSVINYANNGSGCTTYTHNSQTSYTKYYNVNYPFIIEYVTKSDKSLTNKLNTIFWKTYVSLPSNSTFEYEVKDVTFDSGYVYNSNQNSGNLVFEVKNPNTPLQTIMYPFTSDNKTNILISKDDNYWSLNYLFDKTKDSNLQVPTLTNSWSNSDYLSQYPIDKVIDENTINVDKNWYELAQLKSNWNKVRLFFNTNNLSISTYLFIDQKVKSSRN